MVVRSMWRGSVAGLALASPAVVGGTAWAASPVDSELFRYAAAECHDGLAFDWDPVLFTRASFGESPDGDNDVNSGDEVTVSLGVLMSTSTWELSNNVVGLSFAGQSATATPDAFAKPRGSQPFLVPGAEAVFTVPTAAAGTVVHARVDSWDFSTVFGQAQCETVTGEGIVGLYVNKPPAPVDDADTTKTGESVTLNVLANDDATWDSGVIASINPTAAEIAQQDDLREVPSAARQAAVAIASGPAHGTAVVDGGGNVVYTPNKGFEGTDTFEYALTDNDGATTRATVAIHVENASPSTPKTPTPPKRVDTGR